MADAVRTYPEGVTCWVDLTTDDVAAAVEVRDAAAHRRPHRHAPQLRDAHRRARGPLGRAALEFGVGEHAVRDADVAFARARDDHDFGRHGFGRHDWGRLGFPPGGGTDIIARLLQPALQADLGQPIAVENRPGASGTIAALANARAAPDGHTLMVGSIGVYAINAALRPNLGYDPVRDFAPVSEIGRAPNVLAVRHDLPARSLAELLAQALAHQLGRRRRPARERIRAQLVVVGIAQAVQHQ